jgi:hypothetical protein
MHPLIILALALCFAPMMFPDDPLFLGLTIAFTAFGAAVIVTVQAATSYFKRRREARDLEVYLAEEKIRRADTPAVRCGCDEDFGCPVCVAF